MPKLPPPDVPPVAPLPPQPPAPPPPPLAPAHIVLRVRAAASSASSLTGLARAAGLASERPCSQPERRACREVAALRAGSRHAIAPVCPVARCAAVCAPLHCSSDRDGLSAAAARSPVVTGFRRRCRRCRPSSCPPLRRWSCTGVAACVPPECCDVDVHASVPVAPLRSPAFVAPTWLCAAPAAPPIPAPASMSTFSSARSAPLSSTAIDDPPAIIASPAVMAKSLTCVPVAALVSVSGTASAAAVSWVLLAGVVGPRRAVEGAEDRDRRVDRERLGVRRRPRADVDRRAPLEPLADGLVRRYWCPCRWCRRP